MLSIVSLPERVLLSLDVVDLRKGHAGLLGVVESVLNKDATDGVLYLFSNRSRTLLKGIFWDRTGYIVISKRLEGGTFSIPLRESTMELNSTSLRFLLDGLRLLT